VPITVLLLWTTGPFTIPAKSQALGSAFSLTLPEDPTGSFLDTDCRQRFQNASEYLSLFGFTKPGKLYLPSVQDGYHFENIGKRLLVRAGIVRAEQSAGPLRGSLGQASPVILRGWAQDLLDPELPVELELLQDNQIRGRFFANRY